MGEAIRDIDFGFYQSPSLPLAAQECQGLYPVVSQGAGSSARGALFSFPGVTEFTTVGDSQFWGRHEFQNQLYVMNDSRLYLVQEDGASVVLGNLDIGSSTEPAIMADNGETMAIVIPGVNSYFYDTVTGLVEITDSAFLALESTYGLATSVTEVDGYFLFSFGTSAIVQSSLVNVNGGKDFNALGFLEPFLKENLVRVDRVRGQLFAVGENTTKVYRNVATEPFAFQEVAGATIEKGADFRQGFISFDNTFFMWGGGENEKAACWKLVGSGSVQKVSTDAVDAYWRDADYTGASSTAFAWDGQLIVGFSISPNPLYLNLTASALSGRQVWFSMPDLKFLGYLKVYDQLVDFGSDGKIGFFDHDRNSEYLGTPRTCRFAGEYFLGVGNALSIGEVQLFAETGVAQDVWDAPENSDPQVLMEYSLDGGRTWISKGERSMGEIGDYEQTMKWYRMGRAKDRAIFRFTTQTDNRQAFNKMKLRIQEGYG